MKQVILSGQGVCKRFIKEDTAILDHINIDLYEGDFTVIMGASGAGKSTLLYGLSGMDALSDGKVFYRGEEISRYGEKRMAALRAKEFGFVFQRTHLVSNLTLYENILLAGFIGDKSSIEETRQQAEVLIARMNLAEAKSRLPSAVSGGEAQRAAIAAAVIAAPSILFADEPTGALNKANTDEVLDLMTSLNNEGQTVLLVTHDQTAALRGNRVLYLEDGAIIGELDMEPYRGIDRAREEKLTGWLTSLRW